MQKRALLLVVFLFGIVVSVLLVSAFSLPEFFSGLRNKITGSAVYKGAASDSDNGLNYDIKGIACVGNGVKCASDYCKADGETLVEYYVIDTIKRGAFRRVIARGFDIASKSYICPEGCKDGACITPKISVSIATLKDVYNAGEKIELTDPPEITAVASGEGIAISNQGFSGFNAINVPRILSMNYSSISNIRSVATTESASEEINGYIVQFSEAPLTVKERQLKDKKVEKTAIKDELKAQRARIKEEHARLKSEIAGKIKTSRATGMAVAGEKTKSSIIGRIILKLTGKAVSGNGDLSLLGEYENVFNGIALNVSAKEANEIRKISGVKEVFPNLKVNITLMDSVPLINADDVWQMQDANSQAITGKGIKIAIIDTGVDYTHPDLGGCFGAGCKVEGGFDFVNSVDINNDGDFDDCYTEYIKEAEEIEIFCEYEFWKDINNDGDFDDCYLESASGSFCEADSDPMDDHGHGTHCAATAAGNGVLKGVAPDAKIYAYKVLSSGGSGYCSWIISGIERAVDPNQDGDFSDKVDVISMSLGGPGDPDDPMSQAIDNAVYAGVTAVIAAGNSGPREGTIGSPGTARKAITVGASDKTDNIAGFSSRGPVIWDNGSIIKPDIVAPGVNICAAQASNKPWNDRKCFDDNHVAISGTSMATPHVAGAAALIKQAHPDWSPDEIKMALRNTAINIGENFKNAGENLNTKGYGRINVSASVSLLHKPCVAEILTSGEIYNIIDIYGTASCNEFSDYTLYYQALEDISWEQFKGDFSNSVNNKKIYSGFDTTIMQNGKYLIKLAVKNIYGEIYEDNAILKINNFEITGIGNTLNYIKGNEEIKGGIKLSSFEAYKIEYQKEKDSAWTQVCYSTAKPTSEVLCKLNIPNMENGIYYFNMSVLKNGRWISGELFKAIVIKEMLKGWPIEKVDTASFTYVVSDVDKDNFNEIVYSYENYPYSTEEDRYSLYIFENDGSSKKIDKLHKDGIEYNMPGNWFNIPSIYFNQESSENLIALIDPYGKNRGGVIDSNGNFKFNWPYSVGERPSNPEFIDPFVVSDDKFFALSVSLDTESPADSLVYRINIEGFDKYGNMLPNFPVQTQKEETLNRLALWKGIKILNDWDDKKLAILAISFNDSYFAKLYLDIYSLQKNSIKRVYLYNDLSKPCVILNSPSVTADVNNDGKKEIIVAYGIVDYNLYMEDFHNIEAYKSYVAVIDSDGNIISKPFEIKGYSPGSLAIGDFGRGKPDIVVALSDTFPTTSDGQKLVAFDYLGNILFNTNLADYNDIISSMAIGDVNADNEQEIVISYQTRWWGGKPSGFQIFNKNGVLERKIEIPTFGKTDYYANGIAEITDFNNDGKIDIIQQSAFVPLSGNELAKMRIYALTLDGEYDENRLSWPIYMHDAQHTGCYDCIRPESKIVNEDGADVIGNLTITIDRKTDTGWYTDKTVFFRKGITVPANSVFKLDALFNPLDIRVNEPGTYRVYAEFNGKSASYIFNVEGSLPELIKKDIE